MGQEAEHDEVARSDIAAAAVCVSSAEQVLADLRDVLDTADDATGRGWTS